MAIKVDLTGQRFGRWMVFALAGQNKRRQSLWHCRCDCGADKVVSGSSLRSGMSQSCGCYSVERLVARSLVEIAGQRFGRLVALERIEKSSTVDRKWCCICDCGKELAVSTGHLISGHTQSCGCFKRDQISDCQVNNLLGQRFGRLVVVAEVGRVRRKVRWRCRCDCGNEKIATGGKLTGGLLHSCGCARRDFRSGRDPFRPLPVRQSVAVSCGTYRARKSGAGGRFTAIQVSALYQAQRGRCVSCRGKLGESYHRDHVVPLSLGGSNDISNIQLLCEFCNLSKGAKDPIVWAQEQGRLI